MARARVLLVEDNGDDEFLTLRELARGGIHDVAVVRDGCQALEALLGAGGEPPPDLVLLDLQLPKIGGVEVLERLRSAPVRRDVRVLVLSAAEDPTERGACVALGVLGFLPKPLDPEGVAACARLLAAAEAAATAPP